MQLKILQVNPVEEWIREFGDEIYSLYKDKKQNLFQVTMPAQEEMEKKKWRERKQRYADSEREREREREQWRNRRKNPPT